MLGGSKMGSPLAFEVDDYRNSHLSPSKPHEYDPDFWTPGTILNLFWTLEQSLLLDVMRGLPSWPRSVLDFACGTGRLLSFLEPLVEESVGIDVAPAMLEYARRRCPHSRLILGDI